MSPATHLLAGWLLAQPPALDRRDRLLVTLAAVAPDLDGLGIVPELLTRNGSQPLTWFTDYHHVLAHNLVFAVLASFMFGLFARRRLVAAGMCFLSIHLHFLMDLAGSRGPEGYNWPIPYLLPFSPVELRWSHQWPLNGWPNLLLTAGLLMCVLICGMRLGRTPVEVFSEAADKRVVEALRRRFPYFGKKALHTEAG
jgi:membrane-bound metal-dependent hydrolase YbcI (DUF457 family)